MFLVKHPISHCLLGKILDNNHEKSQKCCWSISKAVLKNWHLYCITIKFSEEKKCCWIFSWSHFFISLFDSSCLFMKSWEWQTRHPPMSEFVHIMHMWEAQKILSLIYNTTFLFSSAKKEEEDLEDKKSLKKRIKELKVLDPKIAQNLCKYLFPLSSLVPRFSFTRLWIVEVYW